MSIVEVVIMNIFIALWLVAFAKSAIKKRFDPNTLGFLASGMQAVGEMKAASAAQNQNNAGALYALYQEKQAYKAEKEKLKPWEEFGSQNLTSFKDLLGYNGADKQAAAMDALKNSPAYQFRLNQGVGALDRSAIKGGNLYSGRQMMALNNYGQDLASEEYNNEYNRRSGLATDAYNTDMTAANMAGNFYRNQGNIIRGNTAKNADIQYREYSNIGKAGQQAADNALKWISTFYGGGGKGGKGGGGNDPYAGGGSTSLYGSGNQGYSFPDNSYGTYRY